MLSNLPFFLLFSLLQFQSQFLQQSFCDSTCIDLAFVGDAMQHSTQSKAALAAGGGKTYDYSQCFSLLQPDIEQADYAVVNLECPLGGSPYTGYPCFSAPDAFARQLKSTGFDLFLTANNHSLDRRDKGVKRTIATLDAMRVPHVGTYVNATARASGVPFIANIKGIKVAFLNYTYGTNGIVVQKDVVVDYINLKQIDADINLARSRGAQALCVALHWGIEYKLLPNDEQQALAQYLVDRGVDLIIGGHPHVVEPFKVVHSDKHNKDVLVVYSLGNFISGQKATDTRGGAMVKVSLQKKDGAVTVCNPRYKLFFCQHPQRRGDNFRLIPENMPRQVRPDSKNAFMQFMSRAHSMAMSHNQGVNQEL